MRPSPEIAQTVGDPPSPVAADVSPLTFNSWNTNIEVDAR
jgi:hypothetical protein